MRLFVAVELSDAVRKTAVALIDELRFVGPDVRWVRPDQMHLTLRFLGETPAARFDELSAALDVPGEPFELLLDRPGLFPGPSRPRVVKLALADPSGRLHQLARALERIARDLGYRRERRPYSPHLTLGRISSVATRPLVERIERLQVEPLRQPVDRYILFESELLPEGARHTPRATYALGRAGYVTPI